MLVAAVDVGLSAADALGREFVVAGVLRRENGISIWEQQAWRYLLLDRQK